MEAEKPGMQIVKEVAPIDYKVKYQELRTLLIRTNSIWFSHGSYPYGTDDWGDCSFCGTYRGQGSHKKDCIVLRLMTEVDQEELEKKQDSEAKKV